MRYCEVCRKAKQAETEIDLTKVGGNSEEGPPVPIPNTEVKLLSAQDTWLATARESRSPPTQTIYREDGIFFSVYCSLYVY